ncbi:MAG: preprotein translocase subunit SecE [Clostridia bacterium]|nr:preprotein translocase subunit SecE [Clostridia bacterium]
MVLEGKAKKTILQRLIATLRDYKSELKKIVWPGRNDVIKNTLVVLVICLIIGIFIWLVDFGLGSLMNFITKL